MMSDCTGITRVISNNYEKLNSFEITFCPYCRTTNHINLDWCGSIKGLIFCSFCGGEL